MPVVWSIDWWIDDTRKPRRRKNKNRRRRPTSSMIRTQQQTHTFCQLAPTSHDDILFSMNEWDGCILLPKFLEFLLLSITYLLMLGRETTSRILNGSLFRTKEGEWRMQELMLSTNSLSLGGDKSCRWNEADWSLNKSRPRTHIFCFLFHLSSHSAANWFVSNTSWNYID